MIEIKFNILTLLISIILAHGANIILIWLIHFSFHRKFLGIPIYKIHYNSHHSLEPLSGFHLYYWGIIEHTITILLLGLYYLVCHFYMYHWLAVTFIGESVICNLITYYLHLEYSNSQSWLNQYTWFKRDRQLHQIHHSYYDTKFINSKNFSFGGVTGHLIDKIFRTFQSNLI